MEPDQVHVSPTAMSCNSQQVVHAVEPRFSRESGRDVAERNRLDRLHDDVSPVHRVAATHLHMRARPDPDAAADLPAPDSLAKPLGEEHLEPRPAVIAGLKVEDYLRKRGAVSRRCCAAPESRRGRSQSAKQLLPVINNDTIQDRASLRIHRNDRERAPISSLYGTVRED